MAAGLFSMEKASGGVASITVADGVGATNIVLPESGTVATEQYVDDKYSGFKNYIINGNMIVAHRGSGPFTTSGTYTIDQWFMFNSSTGSNIQRIVNFDISYAQVIVGSGIDTITLEQKLEYPYRFNGKTLTLSYRLFKGSYTGNTVPYCISLVHAGGRTILYTGTHTFDSINKKKFTFTMPDLSGYTLNANSHLEIRPVEVINLGHTGVFGIGDIQLEEGSVATPFEYRPYGLELSLCQRYYEIGTYSFTAYGLAGNGIGMIEPFCVTKRIAPTIAVLGTPNMQNMNIPTFLAYGNTGLHLSNGVAITTGIATTTASWSASAEL